MTRQPRQAVDAPGQDSFLDIVANLVGVLIILIMVVGFRAKDAMFDAAPLLNLAGQDEKRKIDVVAAQAAADAVESDLHRVNANIKRQELEVAYRRSERNKFQLLIAAVEEALNKKREQLDETERAQFDTQRQLIAARAELEDLRLSREVVENSTAPTAVITHLPTPMAQTVFGKELHFRLLDGRLTFVPWDELVEKLKDEAPQKIWRLKDAPSFTETIGPIGGFWMKYTLKRAEYTIPTKVGIALQRRVELDRFVLVPVSENLGEPLFEALQDGSQFRTILARHRPEDTTITVWTYTDSFNEFRTLKQELFKLGYLTASRPLPDGFPIGGSPHGTRSAVE